MAMETVVGSRTQSVLLIAAVLFCFVVVSPLAADAGKSHHKGKDHDKGKKGKKGKHRKDHTPTLVCHYDEENDYLTPITVHAHSVQKHVDKHGDLFPGDTTDAGLILGDDCAEITCPCLTESTDGPTTIGEWVVGAHVYANSRPDPPALGGVCTSTQYSRRDASPSGNSTGYTFKAVPQAARFTSCLTASQVTGGRDTCQCISDFASDGVVGWTTGVKTHLSDDELAACQAVLSAFQDEDDYALRVCGP